VIAPPRGVRVVYVARVFAAVFFLLVSAVVVWVGWWVRTEGIEGAYALAERGALFAEEFFVHCCISGVCSSGSGGCCCCCC